MAFRRSIQSAQRKERRMAFLIDADASSPSITVGSPQATLTRNGAGDYTLTLNEPYNRAPVALVSGAEDNAMGRVGTRAVGSIQILIEDASTNAAADLDVVVDVIGWDAEDEA